MSRLPFELLLALRYLRPKRTFVSVITLISVIGVMLGVAVLIIVISVMSGFDRQLRERLLGFNAHLRVIKPGELLSNREEIMARIMANPRVRGVAPFVQGKVLLETQPPVGGSMVDAPVVRGVDARREADVSDLPKSIKQGTFDLRGNGLIVGRELANNLGVRVGDRVAIYSPANLKKMKDSRRSGKEESALPDEFTVKGVFDVGYYEFNANVVTPLHAPALQGRRNLVGALIELAKAQALFTTNKGNSIWHSFGNDLKQIGQVKGSFHTGFKSVRGDSRRLECC